MSYPENQNSSTANQGIPANDPWYSAPQTPSGGVPGGQAAGFSAPPARRSGGLGKVWILTIILLVIGLLFFAAETWISMTKYNPMRGLAGGAFIGMENFERLLSRPDVMNALVNSLIIGLITAAVAVGGGFIGAALGRGGAAGRRIGAALGLLIAAVPRILWERLLWNPSVSVLTAGICTAIPWLGMAVAGGALLSGRERSTAQAALTVPAMTLILFFEVGGYPSFLSNALSMHAVGLDQVLIRYGVMQGNISLGAAGYVLLALIGLIPSIAGILMISFTNRGRAEGQELRKGSFLDALPGMIIGAVVLAIGAWMTFAGGMPRTQALVITLVEIALALFLGFGIFLLCQVLGGKNRAAGGGAGFARAVLAFAALGLATPWMVKYLLTARMGLVNTIFPVAISWFLNPKTLTLALVLALCRPAGVKQCLRNALAISLMSVVFGIGEIRGSYLYLNSSRDVSAEVYQAIAGVGFAAGSTAEAVHPEAVISAVWGSALLMMGLPLGAGTALTVMSVSKE